MVSDFFSVYQAIMGALKGKSITANATKISIPYDFFNKQPQLRNSEEEFKYPGIVLSIFTPVPSDSMNVNEKFKCVTEVDAGAPYLEAEVVGSIQIQDQETFILEKGVYFEGQELLESQTVIFSSSDFSDSPNAITEEIVLVLQDQLQGVTVSVEEGKIRILHNEEGGYSSLKIDQSSTAEGLSVLFPEYAVIGRFGGEQIQSMPPPQFYNFPFQVTHKSDRVDHFSLLIRLVERLFLLRGTPNQRALDLENKSYEINRGLSVDDALVSQGVFVTTVPFTLKNVPVLLEKELYDEDNYNGGNYDGTGENPNDQVPLEVTLELSIEAVAPWEDLEG